VRRVTDVVCEMSLSNIQSLGKINDVTAPNNGQPRQKLAFNCFNTRSVRISTQKCSTC